MRLKLVSCLAGALVALTAAPAAHGASFGVVVPGDLREEHPLTKEFVDIGQNGGAKTAKFFVTWDQIEPVDGRIDTGKISQYATTVKTLRKAGIEPTIVFFGAEAWEFPDPAVRNSTPPKTFGRFAEAMGQFAAELKRNDAGGTTIAVWNEADERVFWAGAPEPDRYVDLLKQSHQRIKLADPSVRVVFTPLTSGNWRFLQSAYERGARGFFDAVGVDADTACNLASPYAYYRDQQDPSKVGQITFLGYREVRKTMLANGDDKPILLEIGWSTAQGATSCNQGLEAGRKPGGVSEAQQAQYLREAAHCLTQDPYVETAYWFELQDREIQGREADATNPDANFGLMTQDGRRKPAYDAFVQAAKGADPLAGEECGDFTPPAVTVTSPVEGQQFVDKIDITASANDRSNISRVTFQFDGVNEIRNFTGDLAGNDKPVALTPWFGAANLALGKHTIRVLAVDLLGNVGERTVNVEKVKTLAATLRASFRVDKKVSCKKRVCSLRAALGQAPGGPSVGGKILAQWQWYSPPKPKKKGKRKKAIPGKWKTLHRATKPANKTSVFQQKVSRAGKWRLRLTHQAVAPYKTYSAKDIAFRIR
jgi:hypothetical protein